MYITLVDVKKLVVEGEEFQVVDAKTGEDLTRSILLQIILEEEAAGAPMFSGFPFPGFSGMPGFGGQPGGTQPPGDKKPSGEEDKT